MALASLASSKDRAHLTFEEMSFAWPEAKYKMASLSRSRCDLINDRELNSRPRVMPAAKAMITNFLAELTAINISLTSQQFCFKSLFPAVDFQVYHNGALLFSAFLGRDLTTAATSYKLKSRPADLFICGRGRSMLTCSAQVNMS